MDEIYRIGELRLDIQNRRSGLTFYRNYLECLFEVTKENIITIKDPQTDLLEKGKAKMLQTLISELKE